MEFERYAIFWAPRAEDPLAVFERAWFGAAASGTEAEVPVCRQPRETFGLDAELAARAVRTPSRYALHATMKAPFRLRQGTTPAALMEAMAAFCARRRRVTAGRLRLHRFPRFLALVPSGETAELDWLADDCVTHFDRFREPVNEDDRARRGDMSPAEAALFEQFGYHFIFSRFMFHITLAGPLPEHELDAVQPALAAAAMPFGAEPFTVDDLCLFGDPGQGELFRLLERFPLLR